MRSRLAFLPAAAAATGAGATIMNVIGLAAAWVPARRALRIDPVVIIREG